MATVKIDNTAEAWGEHLLALAAEAEADAGEHGTELQLHHVLKDLTTVLAAYAGRLGVEKQPAREYDPAVEQAAVEAMAAAPDVASKLEADAPYMAAPGRRSPDDVRNTINGAIERLVSDIPPQSESYGGGGLGVDLAPILGRIETLEGAPVPVLEIPPWILDTFNAHHERISVLEARLEQALATIDALQRTQQRDTIAIPETLLVEDVLTSDDLRPEAWGSIERARTALSKRIVKKHRDLTVVRQSVLSAIAALANPAIELTDDEVAEMAQHRARSERLAEIDIVRDRKLDEVAGLDDLEAARGYDVDAGWPA